MPERKRRKVALNFEVPPQLAAEFREYLARRGTRQTDELTRALQRHLTYEEPIPGPTPLPVEPPKRPRGRPRKSAG